ncbi:hypothetical protein D9M69_612120 [compost metagenome]
MIFHSRQHLHELGLFALTKSQQFIQVAAGEEHLLGRSEYDTGQPCFLLQAGHRFTHGVAVFLVHAVDRTGHVHSDGDDAVSIFFIAKYAHVLVRCPVTHAR